MNRREFIYDSAMLTAGAVLFSEFPTFAKALKAKGEPELRIGVLSDIHITDVPSASTFRHALEYFRDRKVDGVLIAGDMADNGLERELQIVADTWFSVFPDGLAPDGRRVEQLFIYGNHDVAEWENVKKRYFNSDNEAWRNGSMKYRRAEVWEKLFHEPYAPIMVKKVKGYTFVGGHWNNSKRVSGLEEFFDEHGDELRGKKPFFYYQHAHPKNTCNGPWAWGQDDGNSTAILSRFPNCIAFSGHSHCPLTDERDLWQGGFTSVGTASLRYQFPIGARENSHVDDGPKEKSEMPQMRCSDGRHGMLMSVYKDCIALEKREFVNDEPLGDNWIIPLGASGAPLSFENRAKTAKVPQFAPGDAVTISRGEGEDRAGDRHNQVTVHFPNVLRKTHGVRAFDYEVQVETRMVDVVQTGVTKHVYSPKCYLGEDHDTSEVICVFAETELPLHWQIRFAVRPCECFGSKGDPIYSEWFKV